jgi:hypothetical protein
MKGFWKWFLIVVGILVLIGIAFAVALFFFSRNPTVAVRSGIRPGTVMGRTRGAFGGMMFGMGGLMFFRALIPLGILVLAGFGIAYFVRYSRKPGQPTAIVVAAPVCAHCGKPLVSEWTTCPYCGTKVEPPSGNPPQG